LYFIVEQPSISQLKVHLQRPHSMMPYVCDECQKFFCTTQALKRHQPYTPISKALVVVCVEKISNVQDQLERKKERKRTCIAAIVSIATTKHSYVDHTELVTCKYITSAFPLYKHSLEDETAANSFTHLANWYTTHSPSHWG